MRIETDVKLDFKDVLIRPKRSTLGSRKEVSLNREFTFRNSGWKFHTIPIMASNMDGVGTFTMADKLTELNLFTCLVKTYSTKELIEYFKDAHYKKLNSVAMSIGIVDADLEKWKNVRKEVEVRYVCIDVANGYSERFSEFVKKFRDENPHTTIIAGNVVTGEMTEELLLNGADIIKVGIGPGSVCTTRLQTGVGYPQLSAIIECADAAHGLGGHIIADGGCTSPGDIAKAFAGGSDFVMLGGMLAGHDEGEGKVITKTYRTDELKSDGINYIHEKKQFVQFYGMSSQAANNKHFGGLKEYRSSEGREVLVPYRGAVATTVQDILGGVRSTCTYAGAKNLNSYLNVLRSCVVHKLITLYMRKILLGVSRCRKYYLLPTHKMAF